MNNINKKKNKYFYFFNMLELLKDNESKEKHFYVVRKCSYHLKKIYIMK